MAYSNDSKPTSSFTNDTFSSSSFTNDSKVSLAQSATWALITTTWATEPFTWATAFTSGTVYTNDSI